MRRWQVLLGLVVAWTAGMSAWFVLYRATDSSCGPEIYRDCELGLKVTGGLGRPGIVLLWSLVALALGLAWLTTSRAGGDRRPVAALLSARASVRGAVALVGTALTAGLVVLAVAMAKSPSDGRPAAAPREAFRGEIISAVLHPASTVSGIMRGAARVSVRLRVVNRGDRRLTLRRIALLSGKERLRSDSAQIASTGSLLRPVEPGEAVEGILRFEPRADFTDRLKDERRAVLAVADQRLPVMLVIGRPVR